jgi:hypothetical protein
MREARHRLFGQEPDQAAFLEADFQELAMSKNEMFRYGAPGKTALHLCVDMQRMFAEDKSGKCLG